MEGVGELELKWSFGYNGSQLHFTDDDTITYCCGNTLTFVQSTGKHLWSCVSEGKGVGALAVAQTPGLIAYCETTLEPKIFILDYPSCTVQVILEGGAQLEFVCIAFSGDGKKLASLSGVPDFKLVLWDCEEGSMICQAYVGPGGSTISYNPLNWKQLCLVGTNRISLYTLEQSDSENFLSPLEVDLPDKLIPVGSKVPFKVAPASMATSSTHDVGRRKLERRNTKLDQGILLLSPPDMNQVLYQDSYDEFMQKKCPLKPTCHCWNAQQNVYVGCEHGHLLLVDVETGLVKILANPAITKDQLSNCQSSKYSEKQAAREETNTTSGHVLLEEGGASFITLNRRGLFVAGKNGLIHCFGLDDNLSVVDTLDISQPIVSLSWSLTYDKLAIGTKEGSIFLVDPMKLHESGTRLVSNHHYSDVVGIDVLGLESEYCVSCKSDGILEVWDINQAMLVSKLDLKINSKCSTLCCPTSCNMAIVGTESGEFAVVSLTKPATPRLAYKMSLHTSPLRFIQQDQHGRFMTAVTDDGLIFCQDCRPSSQFAVLGYTDSTGIPLDLSMLREPEQSRIALLSNSEDKHVVTLFVLPDCILTKDGSQEMLTDTAKRFSNRFICRQTITLTESLSAFTLVAENTAISLSTLEFSKLTLPPSDEKDVDWELSPHQTYPAPNLKGRKAILSFHRRWLGILSADGQLELRHMKMLQHKISGTPHCYQTGGCKFLVFSRDGQYLITAGDSGVITCWGLMFMQQGTAEKLAALEYSQRHMNSLRSLQSNETTEIDKLEPVCSDTTWLQDTKETALEIEDAKYAAVKAVLRQEINQLQKKVLDMIATNEQLAEIEQLERQEFILDMEEHLQVQAEEDQLILQVREDIELANLARVFIWDQIKTECWDGMAVKGYLLKPFNSHLEVSNYPLKTRSEAAVKETRRVKMLRSIEAAEKKIRQEIEDSLKQTLRSLQIESVALEDDELGEFEGQAKQQQQQEMEKGDPDALLGSHAAQVGGACEELYEQFNLHSSIARKNQILLLEDCIYQIKETFNKEFNEVLRQKEMEIIRIKEKNVRISKIIQQLKLSDTLVNPALDVDETPDKLLSVDDSEILIEKYISPEEQEKMEEEAKHEEARRLAEMGDNARERALDMMMGGRLEANVEEDLFKDLPRPDFLSKDPGEMSEEEIRMAREFEKKETEFLEEREKLKKALEAELRKLQASIAQGIEQFDERILKLFQLKIKSEMAILQQELMVLCLTRALLSEEEVTEKEIRLNLLLEEKKVTKVHLGSVISSAKRLTEEVQEQYEQVVAEDRELDKSFKRDFSDCEPYVDQLYKIFRKRPRGHRLKQGPSNEGVKLDPTSQNPFAVRPSSATGKRHATDGTGEDDPMLELDNVEYMPEGLEYNVWDRFTAYRRRKVASEQRVKAIAFKLAEMNAFLSKRQAEDDHVQQQIQDTFKELNKLQEDKMIFDLNLEVQFLLKQGQVEVDMGKFIPDFSDSVLVHRSCIEELNGQIKTLGEGKLHSMAECKDFKRGIGMLEWEHKKMRMEAEDLVEKAKDIQMLRVTKDLQQRLMEENVTSKDQNEIETLEKTIELNQKMYKKSVRDCNKTLTKFKQEVKEKHMYNQNLDEQVLECQISVAEQQQVENLAGVPLSEANQKQCMNDIVTRKQLVETIKNQDNQISVLRNELERLRMRAFPALVQID